MGYLLDGASSSELYLPGNSVYSSVGKLFVLFNWLMQYVSCSDRVPRSWSVGFDSVLLNNQSSLSTVIGSLLKAD